MDIGRTRRFQDGTGAPGTREVPVAQEATEVPAVQGAREVLAFQGPRAGPAVQGQAS